MIDTYYPELLLRHYDERPELADSSYERQLDELIELAFGTSDAYSRHFNEIGIPAADLIVNCPQLQAAWSREHGSRVVAAALSGGAGNKLSRALSARAGARVVADQIEAFEPDVLYLQSLSALDSRELERQRRRGRLIVGQIASALPSEAIVRRFDLILTSFPHFVERIRALGVASEYFPIAFYTRVLDLLRRGGVGTAPDAERPYAVSFVGGVDPRVHGRGVRFLEALAERVPLNVWGYGVELLDKGSPLRQRHHGEAWGLDMYRVLARSRIAVNRHIAAAEGLSNNMRLYEATGVGALLCTEQSPNLEQIFAPGSEVVAYAGVEDLAEKITYYLDNDAERRAIAAAGQRRTLAEHTYERRIPQLAEILESRV